MYNLIYLIGKIENDLEIKDNKCEMILRLTDKDMNIPVTLEGSLAYNAVEYCKKDEMVGIKGKLIYTNKIEIKVEKLTFLSKKDLEAKDND